MIEFAQSLGAYVSYSGAWPATLYIGAVANKQEIIDKMIKRFGRHTQIRFA